ncbi:hypothetical protein HDU67_008044 [Dinochytrium kinnereticum]|nr:hypothetical protein HDU67_008044 [Dinochytrium kinnereticum]
MATEGEDAVAPLTVSSYLCLVFFLLAIIPVLHPFRIPLTPSRSHHLPLNLITSPPLAILLLLLTRSIDFTVLRSGLTGTPQLQPYSILILFYSIAYICISLDQTGFLHFAALWCVRRTGKDGRRTFGAFFLMTTLASAFTSNDAVVLTATSFLVHFTRGAGVTDPRAFLMSEFTTANIASMALYIGNPTNVIVAQANSITFLEYSCWMLLPTIACTVLAFLLLRLVLFNSDASIPRRIHVDLEGVVPRQALKDPGGAVFAGVVLMACLVTLMVTSVYHVPVWMVTLPFGAVAFGRDVWFDLWGRGEGGVVVQGVGVSAENLVPVGREGSEGEMGEEFKVAGKDESVGQASSVESFQETGGVGQSSIMVVSDDRKPRKVPAWWTKLRERRKALANRLPITTAATACLPWSILPFSLSMFILVESLSSTNWISTLARALTILSPNHFASTFTIGIITVLLCSLLNNLPASILLSRVLLHPAYNVHPATKVGALYALVAGANLGACLTISGSLAGIMWLEILRGLKVVRLGPGRFFLWNLVIAPVLICGACAVLCGEVWVVYFGR